MAEEKPSPGLGISIGGIHMTATIALLGTVLSGFYAGVSWVTHVREQQDRNTQAVEDLGHKIDGLNQVLSAFNERNVSNADEIRQQILDLQKQLTEMAASYHDVKRLQSNYDSAFSRFQPQPKQGRR